MPASDGATPRGDRKRLGAEGERHAAEYLAARGYRIVARNVRAGGVELDLIAQRGPLVVFVEVKTRRAGTSVPGAEAVDAHKRARLITGASAWLGAQRLGIRRARFDVIACERSRDGRAWRLRHFEGAFDANG